MQQASLAMVTEQAASPEMANPMGTDGFEFVEFTAPEPEALEKVFSALGFREIGRHRSKPVTLWRQGDINFLINAGKRGAVADFAERHGPSVNALAFRVTDASRAYARALDRGARPLDVRPGAMELNIPAIEGIGGSALHLVDRYGSRSIYEIDFTLSSDVSVPGVGLTHIDHLTHNLRRGNMAQWFDFYHRLFNFREIRHFEIEGQVTALRSKALTSPEGKIRIPLNESAGGAHLDQIEEFIRDYNGEGVQHIALATDNIYATVEALREAGMAFQDAPPDTYYEMLDERLGDHGENVSRLKADGILLDGDRSRRLLLQIFTKTCIGPIFFEIIQRKGDDGFGNGNFKALFESIERDQIRRGVIPAGGTA